MKVFVTCLLVAMFCIVSIDASAESVFKVIAKLLQEQENRAKRNDASVNLDNVLAIREMMAEQYEEMFPVMDEYLKMVKKNIGIAHLSEDMIEDGIKMACRRGSVSVQEEFDNHPLNTKYMAADLLRPLCEGLDMPWMIEREEL